MSDWFTDGHVEKALDAYWPDIEHDTPEDAMRAALRAVNPFEWRGMDEAPKDGTPIQAEIPGHGKDNIIAWLDYLVDANGDECGGWSYCSEQEPPDCWTDGICWANNEDGVASVKPIRWKFPPSPEGDK